MIENNGNLFKKKENMSMKSDWLPRNHEALYDKAKQTEEYITDSTNRTRLGFSSDSPQGKWLDTVFLPAFIAFITAFELWRNSSTRTPVISAALYETQRRFSSAFRLLYTGFLKKNPIVTGADLVAMGLPERNSRRQTPQHAPTGIPESEVRLPSPGVVVIHFRNSGAVSKSKPAGVHGAEIVWAVLEFPPTDWAELTQSSFCTSSPVTLVFGGDKRGKCLYFAFRWENTRGDKGNWSAIKMAIIP
jgi:hypothetical protein